VSYHLAAWAMDVDVPPREKLMLILIASHANDEGECFPSQTTLAYRSGLSRRTVLRSLAELEERGIITRRQRRRPDGSRSSDTIRLNVHGAPVRPPLAGGNLTDGARVTFPPQGDSVSPSGDNLTRHGDSVSPHGDNDDAARCPVVTAEPVIEPIREPVRESSAADAAAPQPGPSASTARGTRLPDGWMPKPETIQQMRDECPGVNLEAEHRRFMDYWADQPGAKGRKVRWDSTWRNWIRRANEDTRRGGRQAVDQRRADALARVSQHTPWQPPTTTNWDTNGGLQLER
jgi:DNA-binding transcriptional ArsR family regulator